MSKYAIIETGGHQYRVEENSVIEVEQLPVADHKELTLDQVLFVHDEDKVTVGQPYVSKASVTCDVLGEAKQKKVMSFKFKRRQGYRRRVGHRQVLLKLRVKSINLG